MAAANSVKPMPTPSPAPINAPITRLPNSKPAPQPSNVPHNNPAGIAIVPQNGKRFRPRFLGRLVHGTLVRWRPTCASALCG